MKVGTEFTLEVERRDDESAVPRWESFRVPLIEPSMRVLDALFWVQRHCDPTLAFRCACRVGMCGSCGVIINETEGLACQTRIVRVGDRVRVEPMRSFPVIRDLAVDLEGFFQKYRRVKPAFVPGGDYEDLPRVDPNSRNRTLVNQHRECITCGLCYSACDMVALNDRFLGPAALNRALCLVADERDGAHQARLDAIANEDGLWRCHNLFNCTQVCPKDIVPTHAIQQLKRRATSRQIARTLVPWSR